MNNNIQSPPRFFSWLLSRLVRESERYSLVGDFNEEYNEISCSKGKFFALLWYSRHLLKASPHFLYYSLYWSFVMFKNYFKIALRNIFRHKGYSFINISGLAIGMACCLLILVFIQDELSYDKYHEKADRIYRVVIEWFNSDGSTSLYLGHVAPPYKDLLVTDFGEIESAVRFREIGSIIGSRGEKKYEENRFFFAEESAFDIFDIPFILGDPETALSEPGTIILTKNTAFKYFGDEDPINKVIEFDFGRVQAPMRISGVIEDVPENSHFHFDILCSFKTYEMYATDLESFSSNNYATYILLPEGYDIKKLNAAIPAFIDRHVGENQSSGRLLRFQRLNDIHLHSHLDSEIEANSDIKYVYILSAIAFFILLIACFNFMNLATARSVGRAKEVGLRKVVGAEKLQLIRQFLGETLLLSFISLTFAIVLFLMSLPWFRDFTGKVLYFDIERSLFLLTSMIGITVFVGLAAGIYPAFFLSSFQPVRVLRGALGSGSGNSLFRRVLVVFQFSLSIILIICMSIVFNQLKYVQNANLGFEKEHVVLLNPSPEMVQKYDAVRDRMLQDPNILSVAASSRVPSGRLLDSSGARVINGDNQERVEFRVANVRVSHEYISTYNMEMAAGRDFSTEYSTDTLQAFILNETAVEKLGWTPEEAIGKAFLYGRRNGEIIGVVKDFHFESMHQPITPIIFYLNPGSYGVFSVRISPDNISESLEFLRNLWAEYRPNYPFSYRFVDERFNRQYIAEEKLGEIFRYFSALAVFIACLGLFGLASFTSERRTKEIGIRKVLGATTPSIINLLTREFAKLVLISNLTAWPIAYFAMERWLREFAYRIDIGLLSFLTATFIALVIALLTVSFQAVKTALSNPVKALRHE